MSEEDIKSKIQTGEFKDNNEKKNEIIPVSSRENFESTLKMYSDGSKENFQQRPYTNRTLKSTDYKIYNNNFSSKLDGKMSEEDFQSRIQMFSGKFKSNNEQKKEIIPVSSRENFESTLKMYSDGAKESFQPRPYTNRILKSTDYKIYNNNFPSIKEINDEDYEKINVHGIINDINDKINIRNKQKKYSTGANSETIYQNQNEDLWDDLNDNDINIKKSIRFNEGNLNLKESLKLKGGNLSINNKNELIGNYGINQEIYKDNEMGISNENMFENNEFFQRKNSQNLFESSEKYDIVNIGNEYIKDNNNTNEIQNKNQFSENKMGNNENNIENKGLNNEIITDNQNKDLQEQNNENKDSQDQNTDNPNKDSQVHNNENQNKDLQDPNNENQNKDLQDPNNENQNKDLQDPNNENQNKEEENKEKTDENKESKEKTDENNNENKEKTDENEKKDEQKNNKPFILSKEAIEEWKKILCQNFENITSIEESNIPKENELIKNDIIKTREKESLEYPTFQQDLELMLNHYCIYNKINYKEGLNEIIGAMTLLKYKIDLSLPEIFNLSYGLILKYLTNYYQEEETNFALKSSFGLLHLLLRYHSPRIYNILDKENIFPDMYAKDWMLTLFSKNFDLDLLYYFWNKLILEDDELFFYFFLISLIITNAEKILSAKRKNLTKIISTLIISSKEEIDFIFSFASDLRKETPYSFRILANRLEIFNLNSKMLENAYEQYKPYSLIAMPIFPTEIFHICYNHLFKCPDELCKNCKNNNQIIDTDKSIISYNVENHIENNLNNNNIINYKCPHCDKKIDKRMKYILLDLRILEFQTFDNEKEKTPFMPQMITIEQNELKSVDFPEKITTRFLKDKGTYHFIFMTSQSNFESLEESSYIDTQSSKKGEKSKKEKKISLKEKLKKQEFENLKRLLVCLLKAHYPYISFCYGGFFSCHELSFKYNIPLVNHDNKCVYCKNTKKVRSSTILQNFQKLKFWKKNKNQNQ